MPRSSSFIHRLSLPARALQLSATEDAALAVATAFVDRLGELPLASWLAVGHAVMAVGSESPERSSAWSSVEAAIARQHLELAAWHLRDAVQTVAYLAGPSAARLSRAEHRAFAAAHGAAEEAALALLACRDLSAADVDRLCAPFADCVPRAQSETHSLGPTTIGTLRASPPIIEPRETPTLRSPNA